MIAFLVCAAKMNVGVVRRLWTRAGVLDHPAISDTQHVINPFIDAAKAAGVEQIVLLSLLGAESNPLVPHYRIEHYLQHGAECGRCLT